MHSLEASQAIPTEFRQEMRNHLGVRVGLKLHPYLRQSVLQLGEIFDDAVMNNGYAIGKVWVSVAFCRCAMGRPARVGDADGAAQGLFFQSRFKVHELAFCAASVQFSLEDRSNAG
ncbi:hypothetical protein ACVIKP_005545 [Rhizobium leguminosarum]